MTGTMNLEARAPAPPVADITHAIAVLPSSGAPGRCLSARDSGIWASDDGGVTWRHVFDAAERAGPVAATSLAFAPAAAGSRTVFAGAFGAIVRSIDGGGQWRAVALPAPAPLVTCLAVSPAYEEDGVVLAGTLEDGVLRSDDRGEQWRRWNFSLLDLSVYAIAASPRYAEAETLFAGTETALFKSENGGRSWRETTFPAAAASVLALAIADHGTIWAGTDGHGIWRSSDDGTTWEQSEAGSLTEPINGLVLTDNTMLAVLPEAILTSSDQGKRWHAVISGVSDGGGIAGVALYPARAARERSSTAVHDRDAGVVDAPSSVLKGLPDAQRGFQPSAATAAIAPDNSAMLLIQLRDGTVRQRRIEIEDNSGKENQ